MRTCKFNSKSGMEDLQCLLCHKNSVRPVVTKCGHMFCWECVSPLLPCPCPFCKSPLTLHSLTYIYDGTQVKPNEVTQEVIPPDSSNSPTQEIVNTFRNFDFGRTRVGPNQNSLYELPKWFAVVVISFVVLFLVIMWLH
ncbi:hypothetical protein EIN_152720 [Entamoeba invadens IP1]|uniref:RING-type E3 ubiquitin transferase n=1 Tax=Entamoeba invadens IP1 TaxID=370355 RepID=A0A0A1U8L9_ENTIV|nr:hypothetical protein EIN_152720 [Entamoeba invadens IP1]ELP91275.1 hypothetical protein EIN_152720 [Entamoeba invadens IP1]|eukprot:XP_004258046.1 hypothetical protein EIN_152720 [Entamoeba invadens IP1]